MNDIVILAGGLGERLRHTVNNTQKTMAPVGGVPFLVYLVKRLTQCGAKKIIFALSYKPEQITDYFKDSFCGASILYSVEEAPLGTGGALKQALSLVSTKNVTVLNGDTFFDVDFNALEAFHEEKGAGITLCAKRMYNFSRYGTLSFNEHNKVTGFCEKKYTDNGFINGGVYVIDKKVLSALPEGRLSFEKDVLEKLNADTYCVCFDGYFIDIGVSDDYFRAQTEIPLLFGQNAFKAAFLDRDGVICREKHHLFKPEDFEFTENAAEGIALLRENGYLIIVVTNQAGVAKGLYTERDVCLLNERMCKELNDRAYIDAVYYCPFHPEGTVEAYKKDSPCRKPQPGMIHAAVSDFGKKNIKIDLTSSVIIGDTEKDILTGINAGIGTKILVRSGHKIPDEGLSAADIITDSLFTAAKLLTKN